MAIPPRTEGYVHIEGRRLHYALFGVTTGPVVVLEKGASGGGVWGSVVERIGQFANVVTYDRAGVGTSDPSDRRPTADNICEDLHCFIAAAPFRAPVILVVWSLTGLSGLLHAKKYPADLSAIVFIDPTPFNLYDDPGNAGMLRYPKTTIALQKLMVVLGYGRLWGRKQMTKLIREGCGPVIDEDAFGPYVDSLFTIIREKAVGELYYMRESCEIAKAAITGVAIPEVSALVLSAQVDKLLSDKVSRLKHENHKTYAATFRKGKYVEVEGGSHMMTLDRPDAIVAAVRHLVENTPLPLRGGATDPARI
jgi:pimeloyl-ACP methyl ester carboxylesterase